MAAQSRNIAELENASVWRLLIQYSLPSIAGMVVYSLYNIIDSVFIGHGVGPLALSGLAVTFPIMNLTFALGTLVGIGGAAISSIRLGRKDQEGTERTLGNVLIMSLIAAVVLVIPTLLFLTEILTAFGASGQTLTYAYDFMLITLLGLPVTYVFFNLNHVMRATGYPKKAMGSTLLSVGINIILAPIFIFWFKWGITGAAVATLLAQVVGMVRVLLHFSDAASTVHFRRGIWQLRKTIVTGILSIGMAPGKRLRQRGHRRHQQAACGSRGGPGHRGLRHHQPHSYPVRHARHRPHSGNAAHHRLQPRSHEAGPRSAHPQIRSSGRDILHLAGILGLRLLSPRHCRALHG